MELKLTIEKENSSDSYCFTHAVQEALKGTIFNLSIDTEYPGLCVVCYSPENLNKKEGE